MSNEARRRGGTFLADECRMEHLPRKVLGFDNWTRGAHHFERLVQAFKDRGMELTLLHLGSWGNDKHRPPTEMIGTLPVRDISYYTQNSFSRILETENPAAVLFMSTDTFAHRAFNRYCRYRGLPTIHLYHGIVRVQSVDSVSPYKIHLAAQARFVVSKIPKALRYVWPTYVRALWQTGAATSEWLRFGKDILRGALGAYAQVSADDARTDKCCVYVNADIEHAIKRYGFRREDVVAVGNPDLIQFGLTSDLIGSHLVPTQAVRSDVMYVDTALMYTGWVFASAKEFVKHLIDTKGRSRRQKKDGSKRTTGFEFGDAIRFRFGPLRRSVLLTLRHGATAN